LTLKQGQAAFLVCWWAGLLVRWLTGGSACCLLARRAIYPATYQHADPTTNQQTSPPTNQPTNKQQTNPPTNQPTNKNHPHLKISKQKIAGNEEYSTKRIRCENTQNIVRQTLTQTQRLSVQLRFNKCILT
jgi:hypothetical protein